MMAKKLVTNTTVALCPEKSMAQAICVIEQHAISATPSLSARVRRVVGAVRVTHGHGDEQDVEPAVAHRSFERAPPSGRFPHGHSRRQERLGDQGRARRSCRGLIAFE